MKIYLVDARVLLPDGELAEGAVLVEDGVIAAIEPSGWGGSGREIDCHGGVLLPGMVDLHGDAIEKEISPRPGVRFDAAFAIAHCDRRNALAGVTTAFHAFSFAQEEFGVRDPAIAAACARAVRAHRGLIDNRVHARYEITDAGGLAPVIELVEGGGADLVSVMDHTPGQGQFKTLQAYEGYMAGTYAVSAERSRAIAATKAAARPAAAERVEALAEAAARRGLALASHDDDSPERVAAIAALGARISEFPIDLATARAARATGMRTVLGAPNVVRGGSQSGSMRALDAILDGSCDCLCSDYNPATLAQALFLLPRLAELPLWRAARLVTSEPARAAGLDDRGEIAVGKRADLVVARQHGPTALIETVLVGGRLVLSATHA